MEQPRGGHRLRTFGVEVFPADISSQAHPFGFLHIVLIGQFGMALGELWWLSDLAGDCAADGVYEMFLVSAPLNAPGGFGSPANAVAITTLAVVQFLLGLVFGAAARLAQRAELDRSRAPWSPRSSPWS